MKKLIAKIVVASLLAVSGIAVLPEYVPASVQVAEAASDIRIEPGSEWYIREKRVFGASISVDHGEFVSVTYLLVPAEDGSADINIYQKKDFGEWAFIGVKKQDGEYRRFPSDLSQELFTRLALASGFEHGRG